MRLLARLTQIQTQGRWRGRDDRLRNDIGWILSFPWPRQRFHPWILRMKFLRRMWKNCSWNCLNLNNLKLRQLQVMHTRNAFLYDTYIPQVESLTVQWDTPSTGTVTRWRLFGGCDWKPCAGLPSCEHVTVMSLSRMWCTEISRKAHRIVDRPVGHAVHWDSDDVAVGW